MTWPRAVVRIPSFGTSSEFNLFRGAGRLIVRAACRNSLHRFQYLISRSIFSYNHAVHVIRLRIHLLQKKLQEAELRARSSSLYLCPGYNSKTCNGRYNESEAQQIVDPETGLFLCRECVRTYANHPSPPDKKDYTLQLLDNQHEVNKAMDDMRRVRVQLSAKVDMQGQPLRQGIFDLLQKVRSTKGAEPITSNLPSENIAMGIGSKRIAGTGRTAGILLKKQQKQGILSADGSFGVESGGGRGGDRRNDYDELTFLKNAIGQEIAFDLEKGGGARANLLATKGRIRNKLIDAAAMKVGMDLGLVARVVIEERERRLKKKREEKQKEEEAGGKKKKHTLGAELYFLGDNLGFSNSDMSREEKERRRLGYLGGGGESSDEDEKHQQKDSYYVSDETDEFRSLPEDDRRAAFQAQYKAEVERQKNLLGITNGNDIVQSQAASEKDEDVESIAWEDG